MLLPPRFLFVTINRSCNLRCGHCAYWTEDDRDRARYLGAGRRRELIEEFRSLNRRGAVVICGGESMLASTDYFDVSRTCRDLGLTCLSVINGSRVRTPDAADRMIREGPHEITVSLNSHRAELHDRTRGVRGAFDDATTALRLLLEARRRAPGSTTRIYAMALVFGENYRELEEFHDFVLNGLGADKLKLNFLQPSFGGPGVDHFFRDHCRMDADVLAEGLERCARRFGLRLNPEWLDAVTDYVRTLSRAADPERGWCSAVETRAHLCNSYDRNVMVDLYGTARLCFSTGFAGSPLRRPGDLERFWRGTDRLRDRMRRCNRLCGISHSVRRASATLDPAPYAHAPAPLPSEPWVARLTRAFRAAASPVFR